MAAVTDPPTVITFPGNDPDEAVRVYWMYIDDASSDVNAVGKNSLEYDQSQETKRPETPKIVHCKKDYRAYHRTAFEISADRTSIYTYRPELQKRINEINYNIKKETEILEAAEIEKKRSRRQETRKAFQSVKDKRLKMEKSLGTYFNTERGGPNEEPQPEGEDEASAEEVMEELAEFDQRLKARLGHE